MPSRSIDTGIWDHPDFERLAAPAKLLFIYLCTSPRGNQAGMYRVSAKRISEDTGIPSAKIPDLMTQLKIMDVEFCAEKELVWVKKWLRRQSHSPKFMVAVASCLRKMSDSEIVERFLKYNHDLNIPYRYPIDNVPISGQVRSVNSIVTSVTSNSDLQKKKPSKGRKLSEETLDGVKAVEDWLRGRRGYESPSFPAERKAIATMIKSGSTVGQICACWNDTKRDPFWFGKELFMMSIAKQIQVWMKEKNGKTELPPYTGR